MAIALTRAGLDVDWSAPLPFDNSVAVKFNIPTGLKREDPALAFTLHENTHLWLLFSAAALLDGEGRAGRRVSALIQPWRDGVIDDDFRDGLSLGLWDADKTMPFNDPLWNLVPTFRSHFYDADTGMNWLGQTTPTAVTKGVRHYGCAVRAFRRGAWKHAGHALGLALHYLTDLTQPMHASNFTVIDPRAPSYHVRFEKYVKSILHTIKPPRRFVRHIKESTLAAYYHEVARFSKHTHLDDICLEPAVMRELTGTSFEEPLWAQRIAPVVPDVLGDAVQLTAQFLLMWYRDAAG